MATLTPAQAASLLRSLPGALQQTIEVEQQLAMLDMEADIKNRVFKDGLDANGAKIGSYSTDPIYVSIAGAKKRYGSQIPTSKLKPSGKRNKGKNFLNGNPRKSQYFERGYAGFRDFMGRDTSTVNLDLTGNLMNSIATGTDRNVTTIRFINKEAGELSEHLEDRFGKTVFTASQAEVDKLSEALEVAVNQFIDRFFP